MPDTTPDQTVTPADLDVFDLDAFIEGIVQPTKTVAIAQNRALGQQIHEALQEIVDLERDQANAKAEGRPSKRRAGMSETPELAAARAHLTDLEQQAERTFIFVRVEGLTRAVRKQAVQDAGADGGVELYNQSVLAHTARVFKRDPRTHPDAPGQVLTIEQWGVMAEQIGFLQWEALIDATAEVTAAGVSPDFSQPASPSPDGNESSKS